MSALRAEFYADEDDLAVILKEFTQLGDFKYVQMKSQLNQDNKCYKDAIHLLDEGWRLNDIRCMFLVADETTQLISDVWERTDGSGSITNIHQGFNFDTIRIKLGAHFNIIR
jgi:hypothetical protein